MAMKLIKKSADYKIFVRGDDRYAVQDSNGRSVNGEEKVRILVEEELIKVAVPSAPKAAEEDDAQTEAVVEEAAEEAAEEPAAEAVDPEPEESAPEDVAPATEEAPVAEAADDAPAADEDPVAETPAAEDAEEEAK